MRLFAVLSALCVALLLAPVVARAGGLAFVINSNQASISVIDVASQRELRRIPVLREPHHMALSPDHRTLLVGDAGANEILFLDPRSGAVLRRMPVSDPYQIYFSPNGKYFVVAGLARDQIDVYDAASMKLLHRFAGEMPSHMNFSPDSGMVFVSLQRSNSLIAIDLSTMSVRWKASVGETPAGVLWHDGKLLVGIMGADDVAVVDPATGQVQRRIRTGRGAHVLFVPHDGRMVYVTNRVDGTIVALDPQTLEIRRSYHVSGGPDDVDFAPDGRLWFSRRWAHSVGVLDLQSGAVQTIAVGRSPHGIWLNTHDSFPPQLASR